MCGFIGEVNFETPQQDKIFYANKQLKNRGPDSQKVGYINNDLKFEINKNFSNNSNINIGFSRLSILELSELADQPLISEDGKFALLFNGEIYNFKEIQKELKSNGINFISNKSDTEVVLRSLMLWGDSAVEKFDGQFSIVFMDLKNSEVTLIRDRLGQKPLFFYRNEIKLFFGSTLDSVLSLLKKEEIDISPESIAEYLNLGVVTSPNTIIKDIYKLEPGTLVKFSINNGVSTLYKKRYWNLESFVNNKKFDKNTFNSLLKNSVKKRTISDVPFAALLSGGIDSTTIVQQLSENQIDLNTYSVSVNGSKLDESTWSDEVSKKLVTNHIQKNVNAKTDLKEIIKIVKSLDEPFADSSYIPSYKIAQTISKEFKVAISGDGGDELLMGYRRHEKILNSSKQFSRTRKLLSKLYYLYPNFLGTGKQIITLYGENTNKLKYYFEDLKFLSLLGLNSNRDFTEKYSITTDSDLKNMQIIEYYFYLSEMMLFKIDRSSMANSLEIRSPFVDHKLIEYILSTDEGFYFDSNNQKMILKEYLRKNFNHNFINRPKQGFSFPLFNFIYGINKAEIKNTLLKSKMFSKRSLQVLFIIKNKANAKRLWKMLVLVIWIEAKIE
jgi:asparagine synthase (glutamine-hydrolysing)